MSADIWTIYWAFTAFVFGAIVGSFLNVCIWRLPRGESLSDPPSHCPGCGHRLRLLPDMVPIFSQLWYRSRCRYCGERFSWRYLWVELLTAVVFTSIYLRYVAFGISQMGEGGRTVSAWMAMIFAASLIVVFFIDLEHYQIPDLAVGIGVLAAFGKDAIMIWRGGRELWQDVWGLAYKVPLPLSVLGGLIAFWLLWQFAALATAALGREAMGAGDSLLLAAMGAFLIPWPLVLVAFMAAVALGAVGGVLGLWLSQRSEGRAELTAETQRTQRGSGEDAADSGTGESSRPAEFIADTLQAQGWAGEDSPGDPLPGEPSTLALEGEPTLEIKSPGQEDGGSVVPESETENPIEVPALPPGSRWGRVLTVLGTWFAVAALWGGAALFPRSPMGAIGLAVGCGLTAAVLIVYGCRIWIRGDQEWLPAMDELFEGDPGPRFIPFGPYLVAGTFFAMLFGRQVVEWYVVHVMTLPPAALGASGWD